MFSVSLWWSFAYRIPVIDADTARGSRIGHRPASTCAMNAPDDAIELVRVLDVDRVAAVRHHRQCRAGDRLLHQQARRQTRPVLVAGQNQRRQRQRLHLFHQVVQRRPLALHAQLGVACAQRRMLRQHAPELGEAARVLVLELHARRAIGVFPGEHLHALLGDERGDRHRPRRGTARSARARRRSRSPRRTATARAIGWRKPKCSVAKPPIDRPTTCALSIFRWSSTDAMSSAARACEYFATSSGTSDGG